MNVSLLTPQLARLEPIAEASILKSPVRENRTPGSVPGRPGNRLSYGDVKILLYLGVLQ